MRDHPVHYLVASVATASRVQCAPRQRQLSAASKDDGKAAHFNKTSSAHQGHMSTIIAVATDNNSDDGNENVNGRNGGHDAHRDTHSSHNHTDASAKTARFLFAKHKSRKPLAVVAAPVESQTLQESASESPATPELDLSCSDDGDIATAKAAVVTDGYLEPFPFESVCEDGSINNGTSDSAELPTTNSGSGNGGGDNSYDDSGNSDSESCHHTFPLHQADEQQPHGPGAIAYTKAFLFDLSGTSSRKAAAKASMPVGTETQKAATGTATAAGAPPPSLLHPRVDSGDAAAAVVETRMAASPSPVSSRRNCMQELREALANIASPNHPFLNMAQQKDAVDRARYHRHVDYCVRMVRSGAMRPVDQAIAAKILCREAHRAHMERARARNAHLGAEPAAPAGERLGDGGCGGSDINDSMSDVEEGWGGEVNMAWPRTLAATASEERVLRAATPRPQIASDSVVPSPLLMNPRWTARNREGDATPEKSPREIDAQWQRIRSFVECDLKTEGFAFMQRRLSCMCIFNSQCDDRPYCDCEEYREARQQRQLQILMRLDQQHSTGGCPYFLAP